MGVAADHLGVGELRGLAMDFLSGCKDRGDKVWGLCPFHDDQRLGSFYYVPAKDLARCHSCQTVTDIIGVFNAVCGRELNDPDGFREFKERYLKGRDTVLGRAVRRKAVPLGWRPGPDDDGEPSWSARVTRLVARCAERLQSATDVHPQLEAWGLSLETCGKWGLGVNDSDWFAPYSQVGLPREVNDKGRERAIWAPPGLVLPVWRNGQVVRCKVRRWEADANGLKYYQIKGGSLDFTTLGAPNCPVWVVVETERDAYMLWQELHPFGVGVVGAGSAGHRPDARTARALWDAELILVAMDADAAGAQAMWGDKHSREGFWPQYFPTSRRWLPPDGMGKDPGDLVGKVSMWDWIRPALTGQAVRALMRVAPGYILRELPEFPPGMAPDSVQEDLRLHLAKGLELRLMPDGSVNHAWPSEVLARLAEAWGGEGVRSTREDAVVAMRAAAPAFEALYGAAPCEGVGV